MSNEWFERGELPPVGVKCEMNDLEWSEVLILARHGNFVWVQCSETKYTTSQNPTRFRPIAPIRTEPEKAIEAAALVIEINHGSSGSLLYKKYCESLYDAGLLRLPEDKK